MFVGISPIISGRAVGMLKNYVQYPGQNSSPELASFKSTMVSIRQLLYWFAHCREFMAKYRYFEHSPTSETMVGWLVKLW